MKQTLEGVLKYLRKNYCSYWIILGIDTAIAVLCTWIAYIGIYSMTGISVRTDVFAKIIGISFISSILGSYIFRTYRNTIRFSQLKELWRLMGSACLKAICMVIAIWIFIPQMGLSNNGGDKRGGVMHSVSFSWWLLSIFGRENQNYR